MNGTRRSSKRSARTRAASWRQHPDAPAAGAAGHAHDPRSQRAAAAQLHPHGLRAARERAGQHGDARRAPDGRERAILTGHAGGAPRLLAAQRHEPARAVADPSGRQPPPSPVGERRRRGHGGRGGELGGVVDQDRVDHPARRVQRAEAILQTGRGPREQEPHRAGVAAGVAALDGRHDAPVRQPDRRRPRRAAPPRPCRHAPVRTPARTPQREAGSRPRPLAGGRYRRTGGPPARRARAGGGRRTPPPPALALARAAEPQPDRRDRFADESVDDRAQVVAPLLGDDEQVRSVLAGLLAQRRRAAGAESASAWRCSGRSAAPAGRAAAGSARGGAASRRRP